MAGVLPAMLVGVALGIVARDAGITAVSSALLPFAAALMVVPAAILRSRALAVVAVLAAATAFGGWRGEVVALPAGAGSVQAAIGEEALTVVGTAIDDPRPRGERQQVVLGDITLGTEPPGVAASGRVLLWLPRGAVVGAGDRVRIESSLEAPQDFDGFAYRAYLARQGIAATASARFVEVVGHDLPPIAEAMRTARAWLLRGLNDIVPEPEAALAAGIVLGVRSGIDPAINDAFAAAGLTHVVAISGWNIAIVAALAAGAARPLTKLPSGRWLAAAAAGLAVAAYVLLTGASPSVVRAALMAGGLLMARLGGSRSHAMSALMLAALLMVLAAPTVVWDVGFQLSALATAGLIWFGAAFERRLARWPGVIREPVALTMAAQVTTLPVVLLNFERLSVVAPLANVAVVPLVPVVMLTGAVAAVAGSLHGAIPLIGDTLAWAAGGAAWLYLRVMVVLGQAAASIPMASVQMTAPAWLAAVWYPLVLVGVRRGSEASIEHASAQSPASEGGLATQLVRPRGLAAATLLCLVGLTAASQPDGKLHVMALDIGQGDAILVMAPSGETLLVDGGPDPDLVLRRLGEKLPFWQRRLDIVLLTHPHEDHVAGLLPALERFDVGLVLDSGRQYENPSYGRFLSLAADEGAGVYRLARAGQHFRLGSAELEVLYPAEQDAAAPLLEGDVNNASVVTLLRSGSFTALLEGDAEAPVEAALLERDVVPDVDLLKVGHHGSESSSTPAFLAAARPQIALISCATGNEYGHPHAITLQHLAELPGLAVHRTDLEGTVDVAVDATGVMDVPEMGTAAGNGTSNAGSIGPWWFWAATRRSSSSNRCGCQMGSSSTPRASPAWRPRRHGWSAPPACQWTCASSRSPPCCTTSTSRRPAVVAAGTARWLPGD
jgi:competence protein ComEC